MLDGILTFMKVILTVPPLILATMCLFGLGSASLNNETISFGRRILLTLVYWGLGIVCAALLIWIIPWPTEQMPAGRWS